MAVFSNQTLIRERVIIDENVYENCVLDKCQIVYRGGQVQINFRATDCVWVFEGCAINTIKLLQSLGMLPQDLSTVRPLPTAVFDQSSLP